jgi:hypothetical protein
MASKENGEMNMTKGQLHIRRAVPFAGLLMVVASAVNLTAWKLPRNGVPTPAVNSVYALSPSDPLLSPPPQGDLVIAQMNLPESIKDKQRKELRKYRFEKMKEHGDELAKLAKSLQEDLDKSNANILSLEVVDKAQKIEKLAKKIQEEARFGT